MSQSILVTGGAGFIGSHTCVELLSAGCRVTVVDDLRNSSEVALERVLEVAGEPAELHRVDLLHEEALDGVFRSAGPFDAVIHFAGLKAVGESTEIPLEYYRNNVGGTLSLLRCMARHETRALVFSSSCTVYGDPDGRSPLDESVPRSASNPYGRSKLMVERILEDLAAAEPDWQVVLLRYFNPVGAHPSGRLGEDPRGVPNNLMPFVMQVAVGRHDEVRVFGGDYPTADGTGVRDYIHVVDLAQGHVAALAALSRVEGCRAYNLGTGRGVSVLELIAAASEAVGRPIPYRIVERRPGDSTAVWADPSRAMRELGWRATRGVEEMCADAWRWQEANPMGFDGG